MNTSTQQTAYNDDFHIVRLVIKVRFLFFIFSLVYFYFFFVITPTREYTRLGTHLRCLTRFFFSAIQIFTVADECSWRGCQTALRERCRVPPLPNGGIENGERNRAEREPGLRNRDVRKNTEPKPLPEIETETDVTSCV